jgi:hypothetical protein
VASTRGIATILAELGREDGIMALALCTCTPVDPNSEINRTFYDIVGATPSYLEGRRPWEEVAWTSGVGEEDVRFPSLIDLFVCHGVSVEVA